MLRRIIALSVFALIPSILTAAPQLKDPLGATPVALVSGTYISGESGHATITFAAGRIWTAHHVIEGAKTLKWERGALRGELDPSDFKRTGPKEDLDYAWHLFPVPNSVEIAKEMPYAGEQLWVVGYTSNGQLAKSVVRPQIIDEEGELFCDGWSWPGMSGGALVNERGELVGITLGTVTFSTDIHEAMLLRPLARFVIMVGRK